MSIQVENDPQFKTFLSRVVFEIDPNNGDLLQKNEQLAGLVNNCATRVEVTKYIVIVACPAFGLVEAFRTDSLEKIDSFKITTFDEEFSVIRNLNDT